MQVFKVSGMTCGHCENSVRKAVQGVDATAEVEVDRAGGIVRTTSTLPAAQMVSAIEQAGYEAALA